MKCIITPSSRLLRACRLLGRLQKRLQGGYLNAMPRSIGRQNKTFGGCGPAALVPALGSGFGCPGAGRPRGLLCSGVRVRRGTTTGRVTRILRPFSWSAEPWKVGNGRRADGSQTHITGQKRHRLGARAACYITRSHKPGVPPRPDGTVVFPSTESDAHAWSMYVHARPAPPAIIVEPEC